MNAIPFNYRCFSPIISGAIYSASLSAKNRAIGFPVDYNLIFVLYGLVLLISTFIVGRLPISLNSQKK